AVVLLGRVRTRALRLPLAIEPRRDRALAFLVAAVIAEKDDVAEPGALEAPRRVLQRLFERCLGNRDRSREPHMLRRWVDLSLGHIRDHRRQQRIAEGPRDLFREQLGSYVMLAKRHPRSILFRGADR